MEQNKTLLVIFSAALFLAAILSVGLWFFYPREEAAGTLTAADSAGTLTGDPIEWVRRNEFPPLTPEAAEPEDVEIIVYGQSETGEPAATDAPFPPAANNSGSVPPAAPPAVSVPPAVKPAVPEVPKPRIASPAPAAKPAPKPAPQTRTIRVKEYSIQVGAFSSRDRVDELNEVLKEKGLAGQVLYADGPKLYRLRIGPYTNSAEAEKFLGWVRSIDGCQDSMIFERMATRTVAN